MILTKGVSFLELKRYSMKENWRYKYQNLKLQVRDFVYANQDYDFPKELIQEVLSDDLNEKTVTLKKVLVKNVKVQKEPDIVPFTYLRGKLPVTRYEENPNSGMYSVMYRKRYPLLLAWVPTSWEAYKMFDNLNEAEQCSADLIKQGYFLHRKDW